MPSGPGPIAEERIGEIARSVPPGIATFLLTALVRAAEIVAQHARCRTTTIQLVDRVEPSERRALLCALPGVEIVQVVHVAGPESLDEAREAAEHSHALLLDSGNRAAAPRKELGGTGRTHDWERSARIVAAARVPVWLAGGLRDHNAGEAVERVRPYGLDLCTGVRTEDRLDAAKLTRFAAAAGVRSAVQGV